MRNLNLKLLWRGATTVASSVDTVLKEQFTQKWKSAENVLNLRISKMRTDLERFSIISLADQWILCSEWVPSEWESKQLIKTSQ